MDSSMARETEVVVIDDRNDPAIERILEGAGEHRRMDSWVPGAEILVAAVVEGELVGLAARHTSNLHPERDWLLVRVEPSHRRCGLGTLLHEAVAARRPDRPTKVRIPSTEQAGLRFASHHRYLPLVSCVDVVLSEIPKPVGVAGLELTRASANDPIFLRALGDLYRASHRWDPCLELSADDVRSLLAGDDIIPETLRLALRNGDVVGVGIAYVSDKPNVVEMATLGALDVDAEDGVDITHAVIDSIGRQFLDAGMAISIECDFGPGANTALGVFVDQLAERPSDSVELLAHPK